MANVMVTKDATIHALKFTEYQDVRDGLVGEWKLDGNLLDTSGNGNDGTFFGGTPNYVAGRVGSCVEFDGVDDYVNCGNDTSLDFANDSFSISTWVKILGSNNEQVVISKGAIGGTPGWALYARRDNHYIEFLTIDESIVGAYRYFSGGFTQINDGAWHHLVLVFDRTSNEKLYIDGVLFSSANIVTGIFDSVSPLNIGRRVGIYISGSIDEVRLYNRALTPTEVDTLYRTQLPKFTSQSEVIAPEFDEVVTDGLVAYYELNGNTKDSIGGNDGVAYGSPVYSAGVKNKCMSFDGVDDYVDFPAIDSIEANGDISVCCWVNISKDVNYYQPIISNSSTASRFHLIAYASGYADSPFRLIFNNYNVTQITTLYHSKNTWHQVTAVAKNGAQFIYVDGVLQDTTTPTGLYFNPSTGYNKLSIARNPNMTPPTIAGQTQMLGGLIDDVRIYNRALSQAESTQIYESTKP